MANPKEQETNALNKTDLAVILEVNKKAIELQTAAVSQNEEIIENLESIKTNIESLEKSLYKLQIMLIAGALPIIYEIIKVVTAK